MIEPIEKAEADNDVPLVVPKTYQTSGLVAIRGTTCKIGHLEHGNPLPIITEDNRTIGFASITWKGNQLVADISIDYSTPERLLLQTRQERLYCHLIGEITVTNNVPFLDFYHDYPLVAHCRALIINSRKPLDWRITALGEPVL